MVIVFHLGVTYLETLNFGRRVSSSILLNILLLLLLIVGLVGNFKPSRIPLSKVFGSFLGFNGTTGKLWVKIGLVLNIYEVPDIFFHFV